MPWLADGVTKWERLAVGSLKAISSIDQESAALILSFPWVMDGIRPGESSAISGVRGIMDEDPKLAGAILGLWWVPDDMPAAEEYALTDLRDLARSNPALAWRAIAEPFMEPPFRQRDQYALAILSELSLDPPGSTAGAELLAELVDQPWFSDGLDDLDAALLFAISVSHREFQQALFKDHYVASVPVTLPLAGDIELVVVRHTPFPPDDHTFAALEEGVRAIEGFMGASFPVNDVMLLLTEPDIWGVRGGAQFVGGFSGGVEPAYATAYIRMNNSESGPSQGALYHEIGHYYHLRAHQWLVEGTANFLETYTLALTSTGGSGEGFAETLAERLMDLEFRGCGRDNIQQHLDDYGGNQCNYDLGERFLLAMYTAIGPEAVAAALRELYTQSLFFVNLNEDTIYHAFLSNVPPGKEAAFKDAYRQHHGGAVVDAVLEEASDRPPLVALYNAANGPGWTNNRNWASNAPLGAWHGVATEPGGRVRLLELDSNELVGEIPPELGGLSDLRTLDLVANSLTGEIPPELGSLSKLTRLNLGRNELTEGIPPELANLTSLGALDLWENRLTGGIPPQLGSLTGLRLLGLHWNQLSGEIPAELGNLINLTHLRLNRNQLNGEIPAELGNLTSLSWLDLRENRLAGEIPSELGNLSNLETVFLNENRLVGEIPSELGNLTGLRSVEFSNNLLSGEMPAELSNLINLRVLNLDRNQLSGQIPAELGSLTNFYRLDLSRNQLSGEIPSELGDLGGIKILNLSRNQLTGEIPVELSNLTDLEELFLSGNQLTGCIPQALRNIPRNDLAELGLPFCEREDLGSTSLGQRVGVTDAEATVLRPRVRTRRSRVRSSEESSSSNGDVQIWHERVSKC